MYETVFPYLLGGILAWVTCHPARTLDPRAELRFFTAIMTMVALGFIGFPLEAGNHEGVVYELVAGILFIMLIVLSQRTAPVLLAVTFLAHGAWDLAYLLGIVPSDKPEWVVELCVPYDWLVAAYLFSRTSLWSRGEAR